MFDRYAITILRTPLENCGRFLIERGVHADQVTFVAFVVGFLALPALYFQCYGCALVFILLNRLGDGIDGAIARLGTVSDAGGYLDIVLDFIFYAAVVFGFALANPPHNATAAAFLLFSFMGTGASFLGYGIFAEKRKLEKIVYPNKGFYYITGLTEGTETIIFFVLCCLFPERFPVIATVFAVLCLVTAATRVVGGYYSLRQ